MSLSKQKDEIEKLVIHHFVSAGEDAGFHFISVEQNEENHFDFTLDLPHGKVYMDLMEIIYHDSKGNPYESENEPISSFEFARQIVLNILKKSSKYASKEQTPIHLLTYVTHWRFLPHETVIRLAQNQLKESSHLFENVFFLQLDIDGKEALRVFYPSTNPLEGQDPETFADHKYLNIDPGGFSLTGNGTLSTKTGVKKLPNSR